MQSLVLFSVLIITSVGAFVNTFLKVFQQFLVFFSMMRTMLSNVTLLQATQYSSGELRLQSASYALISDKARTTACFIWRYFQRYRLASALAFAYLSSLIMFCSSCRKQCRLVCSQFATYNLALGLIFLYQFLGFVEFVL